MSGAGRTTPLLPPARLGIMGGGQLGRMTALAARSAGYRVHSLDPDPACAIRPVSDQFIPAGWNDAEAAAKLAGSCDVVTFEIEKVAVACLETAERFAPVRPGPEILNLVSNRLRQKRWLRENGFPVGPFTCVRSEAGLREAMSSLGGCFLKAAEGGYDGRSQVRLNTPEQAEGAWRDLGGVESIAEAALELDSELSVLAARSPNGEMRVYPPAMNFHRNQILEWSVLPALVPETLSRQACELASAIAADLRLEGLMVVEMFVTREGQLLVNELAPRPHNSYHASERACVTGQFEQLTRAICDLPLGSTEVIRPAAIVNLLGDIWINSAAPDLGSVLSIPETRLHLYGKSQPRHGRKMGHISASGRTPEEALERALQAKQALSGGYFRNTECGPTVAPLNPTFS